MKFYQKSLIYKNTTLYDIDFPQKIGIFAIFFKKVSIDGFTHFSSKIHPKFSKNRLFHIPQYIIYFDQNFMLVPTIKLLEFFKNWETYERLLIIFWLFFLLSKVSKMKFYKKILDIQKYNIVRHWFSSKNWNFAIFFKKVSIDGFTHFSSKIHPKFSKNRLFHIPQYIIYLWSEFYARSNNQTIRIFG